MHLIYHLYGIISQGCEAPETVNFFYPLKPGFFRDIAWYTSDLNCDNPVFRILADFIVNSGIPVAYRPRGIIYRIIVSLSFVDSFKQSALLAGVYPRRVCGNVFYNGNQAWQGGG